MFRLSIFIFGFLAAGASCLAQETGTGVNKSFIPAEADDVSKFVPPGWRIEERVRGDLNGDSLADYALKLVEDKPAKDKDGDATERQRALVIVLQNKDGKLSRAAIANKLLQCTRCGGAFYGVMESPANVKIEKGVIIVTQDHGSRWLTNTTYRFRYDADTRKFGLIGFDFSNADRLTAAVVSESTNYLTGVRRVSRGKGNRNTSTTAHISPQKVFIDQVDYEKFEEDASNRLHL